MKYLYILIFTLIFTANSYAQDPTFVWSKAMSGTDFEYGNSIGFDAAGNIFVLGIFAGTVDFDPGVGTFYLTSSGQYDIYVSKLNSSGDFIWAKSIGGNSDDQGKDIAISVSGDIYITGHFEETVDFDPGSGTVNLTSNTSGSPDIFVAKLDNSGNLLWAKSIGGISNDFCNSITVDFSGNVFITGHFEETVDFDPGIGIFNLTAATGSVNIFISKLNAIGNFVWAKAIGSSGFYRGRSITLDALSNVYTTGSFSGTADFDPGSGVSNLVSAGSNDIYISKLDSSGNFLLAKSMGE